MTTSELDVPVIQHTGKILLAISTWITVSKTSAAFLLLDHKSKACGLGYGSTLPHMPHEPVKFLYNTSGHANGYQRETSQQAPPLAGWPNPLLRDHLKNLQSSGSVPHRATLIQNLCETHCSRLSTFAALATSFLRPVLFLHPLLAPASSTVGMLKSIPRIGRWTSIVIKGLCW